jgi:hypothetical protein
MVSNPSTQGSFMEPVAGGVNENLIIEGTQYSSKGNFQKLNGIILDIFSNLDYDCGIKCELPQEEK